MQASYAPMVSEILNAVTAHSVSRTIDTVAGSPFMTVDISCVSFAQFAVWLNDVMQYSMDDFNKKQQQKSLIYLFSLSQMGLCHQVDL
jgi:hypothetical protein